jgi:hypothetical protein
MDNPNDQSSTNMKTAFKKSELLTKVSLRLQQRISDTNKLFRKWQYNRDRNLQAPDEFDAYIKSLRKCHLLQRAERRLTA